MDVLHAAHGNYMYVPLNRQITELRPLLGSGRMPSIPRTAEKRIDTNRSRLIRSLLSPWSIHLHSQEDVSEAVKL